MLKIEQSLVNKVFSKVAGKYDLMNDLMSLGMHRSWKKSFISEFDNFNGSLLDVASGSGDIAKLYFENALKRDCTPQINLLDINRDMLQVAVNRFIDLNIISNFNFICSNAESLPFADNVFDYYTITFGIRNVPNYYEAIKEAYRVLKPCGKFICMEFSKVRNDFLAGIYEAYSNKIIPHIGHIITGSKESYEYLIESIRIFPSGDEFLVKLEQAGFKLTKMRRLNFGVATIYVGYK
jgi:demethylmenaquinone methyltransferase/2-methoxy-6-polyprenyl-1,4-benzoquinol methylase